MKVKEIIDCLKFQDEINKMVKEIGLETNNTHVVFINDDERMITYVKYDYYERLGLINFIKENGEQVPVFVEEIRSII